MKFNKSYIHLLLLFLIGLNAEGCVKARVQLEAPGKKKPGIKVCEGSLRWLTSCRFTMREVSGPGDQSIMFDGMLDTIIME